MTIHAAINDLTNAVRADRVCASGRNWLTPEDRLFLAQLRANIILRMGKAITRMVDLMDELQGDPDLEDSTNLEDEGLGEWTQVEDYGPGCPVGDGGDVAWVEWDRMRGSQKGGPNITGNIHGRFGEDDEDDDPLEDNGDTEPNGDEGDYSEE